MMKMRTFNMWLLMTIISLIISGCAQLDKDMVAFTHVNVIPMNLEKTIRDQTVLVFGSKIVGIGDSDEIRIPENAEIINGKGAYLMPGLADMHMHTRADWDDPEIWPVHPLYLYLANGVTTVRDFSPQGSPINYVLQWRKEIKNGERVGPTIYASGEMLYASPMDDPAGIVDMNYELGFDFIKIYSFVSEEDFLQAMDQTNSLGMYTAGHIPYNVGLNGVVTAGMDEVAHVEELLFEFIQFDRDLQLTPEEWMVYLIESAKNQFDLESYTKNSDFRDKYYLTLQSIADLLESSNTAVCTTMDIDDIIQLKLFQTEKFLARPENQYFERDYIEQYERGEEKHQIQCRDVEMQCAYKYEIDRWILQGLHDNEVLLVIGTDSGTGGMGIVPGYSIHDELRILVESGFTPYEALKTATVNPAIVVERMVGDGNFGNIEIGYRADLLLVEENPLLDLETLRTPLGVMTAGKWFSAEFLNQLIKISDL